MTKNVAIFKDSPLKVINVLLDFGLKTSNSNSGYVGAFLTSGAEAMIQPHEVPSFLLKGCGGVSLWLEQNHNFFIWRSDNFLVGSFDGFTTEEEVRFSERLRQSGLKFSVANKDDLQSSAT